MTYVRTVGYQELSATFVLAAGQTNGSCAVRLYDLDWANNTSGSASVYVDNFTLEVLAP